MRSVAAALVILITVSTASAQTTVTASWDANSDPYTVGYRVYYGTAPGNYPWSVDAGTRTSIPIIFSNDGTYYLVVRAYNAANQNGPASAPATITIGPDPAPTAEITATLLSPTSARVTWETTNATSVTLNGQAVALSGTATRTVSGATTFTLVARAADGRTATATASVTPSPTTAPTAQLTATMLYARTARLTWETTNATSVTLNGQAVALSGTATRTVNSATTFTLVARAADGRTATATARVTPSPTTAPTAQLTATMLYARSARLTWETTNATSVTLNGQAVALSGTATRTVTGPTTFTLVARAADGRTATATARVTPPPTTAPTAQLTATMLYARSARLAWQTTNATSVTLNGQAVALSGTATRTVNSATTFTLVARAADGSTARATARVAPTTAPTAELTATRLSDTSARVTWQTGNASAATINGQAVALSGTTTVPLSASTTFTLVAQAADGTTATASADADEVGTETPGAPTELASAVTGNQVTLAWRAPMSGGAPTHYRVYVSPTAGEAGAADGVVVGNVLTVSGTLTNGRYYASVRAGNDAGLSSGSDQIQFRIGRRLPTPVGFGVTWAGSVATLSWTPASADVPEDHPTGYVLEAGSEPGLSDVATLDLGNATTFTVEVPSGRHYVRVRAISELGDSDATEELVLSPPGTPNAPTDLAADGSSSTVELHWSRSAGGGVATGYVIEAGSAPGLSNLAVVPVGNVTRFVTSAPPGIYYVRVRAVNEHGPSEASNEIVVRR
jgi:hypothetical protein